MDENVIIFLEHGKVLDLVIGVPFVLFLRSCGAVDDLLEHVRESLKDTSTHGASGW